MAGFLSTSNRFRFGPVDLFVSLRSQETWLPRFVLFRYRKFFGTNFLLFSSILQNFVLNPFVLLRNRDVSVSNLNFGDGSVIVFADEQNSSFLSFLKIFATHAL
jgi:hypothetical protein